MDKPRRSFGHLLIILAGMLAFAGCLRADFYMDDFGFILNSNGDAPASRRIMLAGGPYVTGSPGPDTLNVRVFQLIPTGFYLLTERLQPDVAEASWLYHLWNLLLHLGTACFAFSAGRHVFELTGILRDAEVRRKAALWGAILFACHPLCSEPVHYAKCLNSITVGMFGMMAVSGAAQWLLDGNRKGLWIGAGGFVGATLSYFPGVVLAVFWLALLTIYRLRSPGEFAKLAFRWKSLPGAVVAALLAGVIGIIMWRFIPILQDQWERWGKLYPDHWFTQGRAFWDYLAKTVVPVGLSSDHLMPWSRPWQDATAVARLFLAVMVVTGCGWMILSRRNRGARGLALLLLLGLAPLLLRFAYVNSEHFVEYRAYPAMPWLMLLIGIGLIRAGERFPRFPWLPNVAGGALALLFITLSVQRSQVWTDRERLARDVLEKYPLNARAMTQLQRIADESGHPEEIKQLHPRILGLQAKMDEFARENPGRYYDGPRVDTALIESCHWMVYAIADTDGSSRAIEWADKVIATLENRMPVRFAGGLEGDVVAPAWPLLMARKTVADHAAEIDQKRASRARAASEAP